MSEVKVNTNTLKLDFFNIISLTLFVFYVTICFCACICVEFMTSYAFYNDKYTVRTKKSSNILRTITELSLLRHKAKRTRTFTVYIP